MALLEERLYTIEDIYALPEGKRAELIDRQIYYMAPPSSRHQIISSELVTDINNYIRKKKGKCKVIAAPFAVYLNGDESEYYEPDISVICDPSKINNNGCNGAPDWIIEITSPSNPSHDYLLKCGKYQAAGVKEYWIVNPIKQSVTVYHFEFNDLVPKSYTFQDKVKVSIYDDFEIDFNELDI